MDFRNLSIERMVNLSAGLLSGGQRKEIEQVEMAAATLPKLQEAHDGLFILIEKAPAVPPEVLQLQAQQKVADTRHDDLAAGAHGLLGALARRASVPEERQRYLKLQKLLFPNGLSIILKSYSEEAGAATLLARRLTDPVKQQLQDIRLPAEPGQAGRALLDDVLELIEAAKTLSALETQKEQLIAAAGTLAALTTADERRAKNQWIKALRGLEAMLDLGGASEEAREKILGPVYKAAAKAATPEEERPDGELEAVSIDEAAEG